MSYSASLNGWDNLTIEDLLVAYRKAKADYFFRKHLPMQMNGQVTVK